MCHVTHMPMSNFHNTAIAIYHFTALKYNDGQNVLNDLSDQFLRYAEDLIRPA